MGLRLVSRRLLGKHESPRRGAFDHRCHLCRGACGENSLESEGQYTLYAFDQIRIDVVIAVVLVIEIDIANVEYPTADAERKVLRQSKVYANECLGCECIVAIVEKAVGDIVEVDMGDANTTADLGSDPLAHREPGDQIDHPGED